MKSILLYTGTESTALEIWLWLIAGLLFLLLCMAIYRQWKAGRILRSELREINSVKQNNIEYEFVMKAMKIAVWRFDAQNQSFVYENDYRDGVNNYVPAADENYHHTLSLISPLDVSRVEKSFNDICEGRTNFYHEEYQVLNPDGTTYWEESYATIAERDADGVPTKIVGTSFRIDARKELERSLVMARNKAEESDRLKTAFLANMGHEIRTPLNAIVGFADLLPVVQSEEDRNQLISEIQNNNQKLLRIIDGLVSMSQIEAGAKNMLISKFDLNQLFHQMVDTYQPTTNVDISLNCPMESLEISTDRDKLLEIIDNLVQNAVKFTLEGSISLSYEVQDNDVRISISDTGKGISEHDQNRIFERFVKVDDYIPGAGLGLSVVKSHVENLGGTFGVESALGVGSTFWFTLPIDPQR